VNPLDTSRAYCVSGLERREQTLTDSISQSVSVELVSLNVGYCL
jgi:hypothetical protein